MISLAMVSNTGGAGRTSMALELACSLSYLGRSVVLVQADPANLLPHQLGEPEWAERGLVQGLKDGLAVKDVVQPHESGIFVLPFGKSTPDEEQQLANTIANDPKVLTDYLNRYEIDDDAVWLFDTPRMPSPWASAIMSVTDMNLSLLVPDANSLLAIDPTVDFLLKGRGVTYFLLNRFDATRVLHLDIWTMCKVKLSHRLLPFYFHEDQALPEAFASGSTLAQYASDSTLTEDLQKLANWIDLELQ